MVLLCRLQLPMDYLKTSEALGKLSLNYLQVQTAARIFVFLSSLSPQPLFLGVLDSPVLSLCTQRARETDERDHGW